MSVVTFGSRPVGDGAPCYVIAEAGANHNHDLGTAHKLIDAAVDARADTVKFQTYSGKALYSTKTPSFEYLGDLGNKPVHELLDDIALPREWHAALAEHCQTAGIDFLSSPFDEDAVRLLDDLDIPAFKVASFEIVDLPFLRFLGTFGRPVIVSTGMANLGEIEEALDALREGGTNQVCLLQCASLYPSPPSIINLRSMHAMRAAFDVPVGLSDHTLGIHIAPASVALGAALVEKHFTLDRSSTGPDHAFAVEPDELKLLVAHIRDVEDAMGDGVKRGPSDLEAVEMYTKARRSVVAATKIPAGTPITREMLTVKRPGFGIKPKFIETLVGRIPTVNIDADDVITWEMV